MGEVTCLSGEGLLVAAAVDAALLDLLDEEAELACSGRCGVWDMGMDMAHVISRRRTRRATSSCACCADPIGPELGNPKQAYTILQCEQD